MMLQCCKPLARSPPWVQKACSAGVRCISTSGGKAPFAGTIAHAPSCACTSCGTGLAGRPIDHRQLVSAAGATNRGVVYMAPGDVAVQPIEFPKLELDSTNSPVVTERQKRKCEHGAILKVVTTNICGSDQHMVRGRTSLPGGYMVLGQYALRALRTPARQETRSAPHAPQPFGDSL